jgi:chitinase
MIGMNDVQSEIFDQQEAREVLAFAQSHGISRISIWSLNRDYQNSAGAINHVDNFSSSLVQTPLEFSLLFNHVTVT